MKDQLQILWQLQALEREKARLLAEKENLTSDEVRCLWLEIRLLTQNIAANREKLLCLEKICSRQEADLAGLTQQCRQTEAKLYSGEITNIKELEQIKAKYDSNRRDIACREDDLFYNMEQHEQLSASIAQEEDLLHVKRHQHIEKQQEVVRNMANSEASLSDIDEQCGFLVTQVDKLLLDKYRGLSRRLALPLAKVSNGICSGCRMSVPISQTAVQQGINYCDNCGRILLVE